MHPELSKESIQLILEVLGRQQIQVGSPDFLELATKLDRALRELRGLLSE